MYPVKNVGHFEIIHIPGLAFFVDYVVGNDSKNCSVHDHKYQAESAVTEYKQIQRALPS